MKKLILAVLAVVVIGNTNNVSAADQGLQILEQAGAGVLGAAIGYNGAKAAGANQPWAIAGGIAGANVGVSMVRAYQQPARRPIYRGQPQYQGGQYYDSGIDTAYARGAQERERQDQMSAEQCAYQRGRGNYGYNCYSGYSGGGW